jgi:hypothetical protein
MGEVVPLGADDSVWGRRPVTEGMSDSSHRRLVVNRSQVLVLGFFGGVWIALVAILAFAPGIYIQRLNPPPDLTRVVEIGFLVALTALIVFLVVGVIRRWQWAFWLVVVAFLAGVLRAPASILELTGILPAGEPSWYVGFQGVLGLIQFAIGLALLRGYRRAGIWGAF